MEKHKTALIKAAEEREKLYEGDDRFGIKDAVACAFFAGARYATESSSKALEGLMRYSMWSNSTAQGMDASRTGQWVDYDELHDLLEKLKEIAMVKPESTGVHPSIQQEIEKTNLDRSKWTTKQWYEHVGAWETSEGYISFGSVMSLGAMLSLFQSACVASQRLLHREQLGQFSSEAFEEARRANKFAAEWGLAQIKIAELRNEISRLRGDDQYTWNEGDDEHS